MSASTPLVGASVHAINGKRVVVSLVSWLLAGVGVVGSPMFFVAWLLGQDGMGPAAGLPLLAWAVLGVMNLGWLQDRRVHWFWPVAGMATGLASAGLFIGVFFFYVAALPLAFYWVYWHLLAVRR